jgi:hypothetical protein
MCSLKMACRDYGCTVQKGNFDHRLITCWDDVEEHKRQWGDYLQLDVLGLKELYFKFATQVWDMFEINVNKRMTLSQMSYDIWLKTVKEQIEIPLYQQDKWIRRAVYGGRVYPQKQHFKSDDFDPTLVYKKKVRTNLTNDGKMLFEPEDVECLYYPHPEKIGHFLFDADVVSLYPAAMMKMFPYGKMKEIDDPVKLERFRTQLNDPLHCRADIIAEVDVMVPKDLVCPVLPRKGPKQQGILWDLEDIESGVYTSIDLWRAVRKGYYITRVHAVMRWSKVGYLFKEYIERMFELKSKASKGTAEYNVAKGAMCSLFGKALQTPPLDKVSIVYTTKDVDKFRNKYNLDFFFPLPGDEKSVFLKCAAALKGTRRDVDAATNKPCQLGAFILSWSRALIDEVLDRGNMWYDINRTFWYTDTDSLIMLGVMLDCLKAIFGSKLGQLAFDVKGKIVRLIVLNPKEYMMIYVTKDGRVMRHVRTKGIPYTQWGVIGEEQWENMLFQDLSIVLKHDEEHEFVRFRKVAWKVTDKERADGLQPLGVTIQKMERIMNKSLFQKRSRILDEEGNPRPDYATLPLGYEVGLSKFLEYKVPDPVQDPKDIFTMM